MPSVVPGMIIGSAGATIAELMDSTQTTIKFSRGQEQYPGTNDRICCISGPVANICDAVREVFNRMNDPSHTRYVYSANVYIHVQWSGTSLIRTPLGQTEVSLIEWCP